MLRPPAHAASGAFSPLERQLASYGPLSPSELAAVQSCTGRLPQSVSAGGVALVDGSIRVLAIGLVGWAGVLPDGRRQIVEISVPGDLLDRRQIPGATPIALTRIKTWDARPLIEAQRAPEHDGLRRLCARAHEARLQRLIDHIVRLGRFSAFERMASLLLDLFERHQRAGLSAGERIPWSLTQEVLADALGLSIVHLNRTFQAIRREGLAVLGAGHLDIPDRARMAEAACRERPPTPTRTGEPRRTFGVELVKDLAPCEPRGGGRIELPSGGLAAGIASPLMER